MKNVLKKSALLALTIIGLAAPIAQARFYAGFGFGPRWGGWYGGPRFGLGVGPGYGGWNGGWPGYGVAGPRYYHRHYWRHYYQPWRRYYWYEPHWYHRHYYWYP